MAVITFKDKKAFNKAVNKHVDAIVEQRKAKIAEDLWKSIEPVISTCLYEAYSFGEVRQEKFFKYFTEHISCLQGGHTSMEMYIAWCKDHNYRIYEVDTEDTKDE